MRDLPYPKEALHSRAPQREYGREARQTAFLLGGIGAGNVSIGSRGELRDWEIFNISAKGQRLPYGFFSIAVKTDDTIIAKVLESQLVPPFAESHGFHPGTAAGLPRFKDSKLRGEYPFVYVDFIDDSLPVKVSLEAYTPLIPHEPDDSGLPAGILTYSVKNTSKTQVEVSIVGSLTNMAGFSGYIMFENLDPKGLGGNVNEYIEEKGLKGLYLYSNKHEKTNLLHGNMSIATTNQTTTVKRHWYRSGWWDLLREFWDDLAEDGKLTDLGYTDPSEEGKTDVGSLGAVETIEPGETKEFKFIISWYYPNRVKNWTQDQSCGCDCNCGLETVRNRYALRFDNAWEVSRYIVDTYEHLDNMTRSFHDALFNSTLPSHILDAISANITVLRSNTCFWLEDGRFFGYEGCFDDKGCCSGNCTHVWNYEHTLAFLFPSLERSMRETEFQVETDQDGKMSFRAMKAYPGTRSWDMEDPASDGQCGSIMRAYREWKLSGDTDWMNGVWSGVKRAMDYSIKTWDPDEDGVTDGRQHNTYDIQFYGPNPLTGIMYLAALKAANKMAESAGDYESAERYLLIYERGRVKLDEVLWNGEFYVQRLEDVDAYKYQHGLGCLADQLLGQVNAHVMGIGYVLDPKHVSSAVKSIFKYNMLTDFSLHDNCQRTYVLNDEAGLLACTWPNEGRPKYPFVYSHEVWTGIEYQVAAHLIYEGHVDEGLSIVKAVRDRHDGVKRNPWNEVECGHHYARSMASWGLLTALSGYKFDMVHKELSFDPAINRENFTCFWSTGTAWGTYSQETDSDGKVSWSIRVLHGNLGDVKVNGKKL